MHQPLSPPKKQNLYEVWGDTIDGRDLMLSGLFVDA